MAALINAYFAEIVFTKAEVKEEFSLYAALLNHGSNKFVIAFVRNHLAVLREAHLAELQWECLQTRTLARRYNLKSQSLHFQTTKDTKLPNPMFRAIERKDTYVKYQAEDFPLELLLINDPKKKGSYQYPQNYNLVAAILSFNAVITPLMDRGDPVAREMETIEFIPPPN